MILCYKNDYIKDTRIRRTYSGRKGRATYYLHPKGSPYRDAKGSAQLRSCLYDAIINSAPRIGGNIDKMYFYRQCTPILGAELMIAS